MTPIVSVKDVQKTYDGGFEALKGVSLDIRDGEVLALLGPNGAGKTTLISIICGIATATSGQVKVGGHDTVDDYRAARSLIGLVPQEINLEPFETVMNTVTFSRGLFGKPRDDAHMERILRQLSLWDKKDAQTKELSGGMKRRVLIAKALAHEPKVLFLDEPTAGVDVELRRDMWETMKDLKSHGVTIILTTHYIEEAELMADRIGIIAKGEIRLVREKEALMAELGKKQLVVELSERANGIPESLGKYDLTLSDGGSEIVYHYDSRKDRTGITRLLNDLQAAGLQMSDVRTEQSSLEDIFVDLTKGDAR